jgi:glycosyltransferase involved in cell wall biosynthesis
MYFTSLAPFGEYQDIEHLNTNENGLILLSTDKDKIPSTEFITYSKTYLNGYKDHITHTEGFFMCYGHGFSFAALLSDRVHIYRPHEHRNHEKAGLAGVSIYTMSNKDNHHLKRLQNSADYYRIPLTVLRTTEWPNNLKKIALIQNALSRHEATDLVMVIDAWDVIFAAPEAVILEKFKAFNADVVFSAQCAGNLWARMFKEEKKIEESYRRKLPSSPTIYNSLCAGSFMGYAGKLSDIIKNMLRQYTSKTTSEQAYYARYFIDFPGTITLDYHQELFSCENPVKTRTSFFRKMTKSSPDNLRIIEAKIYNTLTKTNPAVIHTPAGQYAYLEKLYYRLLLNNDALFRPVKKYHVVLGITSFNRLFYLRKCIETFLKTKAECFQWTLIVADDGSTDGSVEYIQRLKPVDCNVILISNGKRSISYQTNTIFKMSEIIKFDYLFKSDDDMKFTAPGWDVKYIEAIEQTGMDHLIFVEPSYHFKNNTRTKHRLKGLLEGSLGNPISGCFFTITPNVLKTVGYFDVLHMEHKDYSKRCFKKNFNDEQYRFDIVNSGKYLKMQGNYKQQLYYGRKITIIVIVISAFYSFLLVGFIIILYSIIKYIFRYRGSSFLKTNDNNVLKQDPTRMYVGISSLYKGTRVYLCHKVSDISLTNDYFIENIGDGRNK